MKPNIFWVAAILWIGVIFYFSSKPADVSRKESGQILAQANIIQQKEVTVNAAHNERESMVLKAQHKIRKLAHVIEYFILGALIILAFTFKTKISLKKVILACVICVIIPSADEFHQKFVPGRGPLLSDVIIDASSCFAAIVLILAIKMIIMLIRKTKENKDIRVRS